MPCVLQMGDFLGGVMSSPLHFSPIYRRFSTMLTNLMLANAVLFTNLVELLRVSN